MPKTLRTESRYRPPPTQTGHWLKHMRQDSKTLKKAWKMEMALKPCPIEGISSELVM
jgi:hypothetical protein